MNLSLGERTTVCIAPRPPQLTRHAISPFGGHGSIISVIARLARLLDLGCGSGRPIARYLIDQEHQLTGLDFSPDMIDLARSYFPTHEWVVGDMRYPPQTNRYDGLISWDGFFHLNASEQRQSLPLWCELLKPDGALLLTIGHEAGR